MLCRYCSSRRTHMCCCRRRGEQLLSVAKQRNQLMIYPMSFLMWPLNFQQVLNDIDRLFHQIHQPRINYSQQHLLDSANTHLISIAHSLRYSSIIISSFNMKTTLLILLCVYATLSKIHLRPLANHRANLRSLKDFQNAQVLHSQNNYQIVGQFRVVTTLNVPDVFQATDYTCGPSSLTAVLNYFHIDQREMDLAKMAKTNEQVGTDPYDLLAAIRQLGLRGQMKENMTVADIQDYLQRGYPVIVLIQAWKDDDDPTPYPLDTEDGHYVVAIGYDADYLYFEDPWIIGSLTFMKKSELPDRWHGSTVYPKDRLIYGCGIVVLQEPKAIPTVIHMD